MSKDDQKEETKNVIFKFRKGRGGEARRVTNVPPRVHVRKLRNIDSTKSEFSANNQSLRERVLEALNNPKYKARTLSGIAKETNISQHDIKKVLNSEPLISVVKVIPKRAENGNYLITTKTKFENNASLKDKFIDFFASKRGTI